MNPETKKLHWKDQILLHIMKDSKQLNRREQEYYNHLMETIDNQLIEATNWLGTDEAREINYATQQELTRLFNESELNQSLHDIIYSEDTTPETIIERFYNAGATLGYHDINRLRVLTPADGEALSYLTKYNFELIHNLGEQVREGIRETIFTGVTRGSSIPHIRDELLELPLQPLPVYKEGKLVYVISPRVRAEMIARTETSRAMNNGTLQAYANYGVTLGEIIPVHDDRVCDECLDLEDDNPYPLQELQGMIPVHPNCRCTYGAIPESIPESPVDEPEVMNLTPIT